MYGSEKVKVSVVRGLYIILNEGVQLKKKLSIDFLVLVSDNITMGGRHPKFTRVVSQVEALP